MTAKIESDDLLPEDVWHHIVATYDGRTMSLFVNGQKQKRTKSLKTTIAFENVPISIGQERSTFELVGKLDEVMVYDRAMSDREILTLYRNQK